MRFDASTRASKTKRACKFRFRTFVTISLLLVVPAPFGRLPFVFGEAEGT